jgi:hypothetical protein
MKNLLRKSNISIVCTGFFFPRHNCFMSYFTWYDPHLYTAVYIVSLKTDGIIFFGDFILHAIFVPSRKDIISLTEGKFFTKITHHLQCRMFYRRSMCCVFLERLMCPWSTVCIMHINRWSDNLNACYHIGQAMIERFVLPQRPCSDRMNCRRRGEARFFI